MRVARSALCACACLLLVGSTASAREARLAVHDPVVASASGHSHFVLTDVFGLQTLVLQDFSFWSKLHASGAIDGAYVYSDLEDGAPFTASGPITCLVIRGEHVWAGGPVTASNDPTQVGQDAWWQAADNRGLPDSRDMTTLLGVGLPGQAQSYCDAAPSPHFPWPAQRGAIHVRDSRAR